MNKTFLIAGGIAAFSFIAKLAYQKFFNTHTNIPKEVVIQKLIDTKEYLYAILF